MMNNDGRPGDTEASEEPRATVARRFPVGSREMPDAVRGRAVPTPGWGDQQGSRDVPPPPREYIGPKRYGYPRIRRSRLEELEQRVEALERATARAALSGGGEVTW